MARYAGDGEGRQPRLVDAERRGVGGVRGGGEKAKRSTQWQAQATPRREATHTAAGAAL